MNTSKINIQKEENMSSRLQSPIHENIYIDEKESYSCTECSSGIEILSINYDNSEIKFKCLNENVQNNHGTKTMQISEYIKKMKKNTYLYDRCSICSSEQSLIKNFFNLKYCINCKKTVCNKCKEKHMKNGCNEHFFINNNERMTKCSIHPDKNNEDYCFDCSTHLCINCLETRKHIEHNTKSLLQFIPKKIEKMQFQQSIDELNEEKRKIEKEKENEINEYNNNLSEIIKEIKEECEKKIKSDEKKEKEEIEEIENKKG
jgi:ribosomal protein S14